MRFNNVLYIFIFIWLFGCQKVEENSFSSTLVSQVVHNTETQLTLYPNQQKASSIEYVDGKKHGVFRKWFEDGALSFESHYVNGKRQGNTKSWWRNGNLRSESHFEKGVAHGIQKQWYISGAKFKLLQLSHGKEEGIQQSWRENGKVYNNYEAKNGRIFGLKRANLCYQLENEIIIYSE